MKEFKTLLDLVPYWAKMSPDHPCIQFFHSLENFETITFQEFYKETQRLAGILSKKINRGDRVAILLVPGIEYPLAFFSILWAGGVPVPLYVPYTPHLADTLEGVFESCQPTLVLTNSKIHKLFQLSRMGHKIPFGKKILGWLGIHTKGEKILREIDWLTWEAMQNDKSPPQETPPPLTKDDLAFLMYTSGSTGSPKGVEVTHENILFNLSIIIENIQLKTNSRIVSWLPPYHDMGLIDGILLGFITGNTSDLMSPQTFIRDPLLWLEISARNSQAAITPSPNFGYALCIKRYDSKRVAKLDLSNIKLAANGAEPIRKSIMEQFAKMFGKHGFEQRVFYPCYGLAESTIFVSGNYYDPQDVLEVSREGLQENRLEEAKSKEDIYELVSSGFVDPSYEIAFLDPETGKRIKEGKIGEICLAGKSITKGYYRNPKATRETFQDFLRTGDLGFLKDKKLYITGRIKDLIIVRGKNFYPNDIEYIVEELENVRKGGTVAVSHIDPKEGEKLILLIEIKQKKSKEEYEHLCELIQFTLTGSIQIKADVIALLPAGTVIKGSSGKLKRYANKELFLQNRIKNLFIRYF